MKQIQRIAVSEGEAVSFGFMKKANPIIKRKIIYSFFPCDRGDCECQPVIQDLKNKFSNMQQREIRNLKFNMEYLRCPKDKTGMVKFKMVCNNCKEIVGELYATDETARDFCDFHYISVHDGNFWQGALTPNISPIDQLIGMECCCGNDSRDFRANHTLPELVKAKMIEKCSQGRLLGRTDSRFKLIPI